MRPEFASERLPASVLAALAKPVARTVDAVRKKLRASSMCALTGPGASLEATYWAPDMHTRASCPTSMYRAQAFLQGARFTQRTADAASRVSTVRNQRRWLWSKGHFPSMATITLVGGREICSIAGALKHSIRDASSSSATPVRRRLFVAAEGHSPSNTSIAPFRANENMFASSGVTPTAGPSDRPSAASKLRTNLATSSSALSRRSNSNCKPSTSSAILNSNAACR